MRRRLLTILAISTAALVGAAQAAPAAPVPGGQDTVELHGGATLGTVFSTTNIEISASSGPDGEQPAGSASMTATDSVGDVFPFSGPVTCLAVSGNAASIEFISSLYGRVALFVVDNGPGPSDTFNARVILPPQAFDCRVDSIGAGLPLSSGDAVVHDAPALPTTKQQCKDDGWRSFGTAFRNQGQCVAFVERGSSGAG